MARRHVVDMHEVQSGIDESGNAARRGFDDHPPRRRRFDVARSDGRGGIDDHSGQAFLRNHPLDQPLGGELARLIGADGAVHRVARSLVRRCAVQRLQRRDADVYTTRSTPAASAACITVRAPSTLLRTMSLGSRAHSR